MNPPTVGVDAQQLAVLVDAIEDYAIFLLSPSGEILSWNSGATRVMGYAASEVIGTYFTRFYGPRDLAAQKPQNELATAAREGRIEDEGWRIRKDGTPFWANTIITALRDRSGRVTGFAKVTRDLTQRREAEARLRQSEETFRLLVESVRDYAIFLLDPGGHIMTWNAGAQRIKGYSADEIIGRHFSTFYPEEDIRNGKPEMELEVAERDGSIEDEGWRLRKDGTRFWANVIITAVRDERGRLRGFAKVTRDLTERKRAEETQRALQQQREERQQAEASYRVAQEANRAKDEFLMTLSHELRTPLTAILGWSRLLPSLSPADGAFTEAIASIGRSAQVQARIIDDVLDVSRIVSGKLRLTREEVNVERVLLDSLDAVRPSAEAKNVTLLTTFGPDLGNISADQTRIQQIVWNLLTNAVKFTPNGGQVHLSAERTASHVCITVSDNGEGIDTEFLTHVFEPFKQAESPSTRVHGGLGLGLSIVRYLVEAHGGTITAESAGRGKGASFTVNFPLGATFGTSPIVTSPDADRPVRPVELLLEGKRIAVVDDDDEGRQLIRAVLRRAGAEVFDFASPEPLLRWLAGEKPDLVVTDIAMPHLDGYTLARRIRETTPEQRIIALSAFPASRAGGDDSPFDGFVAKPVEPADLVEACARVIGSAPAAPA